MSKFSEVLDQLRENQPKAKYGIAFEKLMVNYFKTDPTLKAQFDEVYRGRIGATTVAPLIPAST